MSSAPPTVRSLQAVRVGTRMLGRSPAVIGAACLLGFAIGNKANLF